MGHTKPLSVLFLGGLALAISACSSQLEAPLFAGVNSAHAPETATPRGDSTVPLGAYNLAFTASVSATPTAQTASAPPTRFESGQTLSGGAVLALLDGRDAASQTHSTMFQQSTLSFVFRDIETGIVRQRRLAECESLDFETVGSPPFQQGTVCDGSRYTFGVSDAGLLVKRNGKTVRTISLRPGLYTLNGVRFDVPSA